MTDQLDGNFTIGKEVVQGVKLACSRFVFSSTIVMICESDQSRFLEDLMSPEPIVLPNLDEAQLAQAS